ncbi:MAG TPA: cytochrome c [Phenylobacterium sp.]|jgi:cytochrome c551/c552
MLRLLVIMLAAAAPSVALAQEAGADSFRRCAACHLPNGAGVPGSYPPLSAQVAGFSRSTPGRSYLIAVVAQGLAGPTTIGGAAYNGFMPAQPGLSDQALADTLNHLLTTIIAAADVKPFTAEEVRAVRAQAAGRSAQQSLELRPPEDPSP